MPLVRFKATPERSHWRHSKESVVVRSTHGDGETTKIRGDGYLRDQDLVEMTDFEAEWTQNMYPDNFEIVEDGSAEIDPDDYLKDELLDLADEQGLDVDDSMTKMDVADAINEALGDE